jgi:hypothetical protein
MAVASSRLSQHALQLTARPFAMLVADAGEGLQIATVDATFAAPAASLRVAAVFGPRLATHGDGIDAGIGIARFEMGAMVVARRTAVLVDIESPLLHFLPSVFSAAASFLLELQALLAYWLDHTPAFPVASAPARSARRPTPAASLPSIRIGAKVSGMLARLVLPASDRGLNLVCFLNFPHRPAPFPTPLALIMHS